MTLWRHLAVFVAAAAWRLGVPWGQRRLIAGLGSGDGQERLIAGILVVRSGARATGLLAEALHRRPAHLPHLLRVIGDAAPSAFMRELEQHVEDPDPLVRQAARDALRAAAAARTGAPH